MEKQETKTVIKRESFNDENELVNIIEEMKEKLYNTNDYYIRINDQYSENEIELNLTGYYR